jgi:hypothetical protein
MSLSTPTSQFLSTTSAAHAAPADLLAAVDKLCEVGDGIIERCEEIGSMCWKGDRYQFEDLMEALATVRNIVPRGGAERRRDLSS